MCNAIVILCSYFLPEGRSCLVRASAALLLVQLMQASPSPSRPWPSPVVADVCTGVRHKLYSFLFYSVYTSASFMVECNL